MPKTPILQLVPGTGKKLADVARVTDFNGVMFTALLGALIDDQPRLKHKMLTVVRGLKSIPGVTSRHQAVFDNVIKVIEQMIAAEDS